MNAASQTGAAREATSPVRYRVLEQIGSGGMAAVHMGFRLGPFGFNQAVAIKRLHEQYAKDDAFVAMLIDEARLAACIHHPNVIPLVDLLQHEGQVFVIFDYVHGESVSRLIRTSLERSTPIPQPITLAIVTGALAGLHAAHEACDAEGRPLGLIHRDVSPHNILVGLDGAPRVFDFGVAKAFGRVQQTQASQVKGKLGYMAPEQMTGGVIDRRADLFAAGVVLWELLAGDRLFHGLNDAEVVRRVLFEPTPSVRSVNRAVSVELEAVVARALSRDPYQRLATALEMVGALERCGPVATASDVGAWVEQLVGPVLAARQAGLSSPRAEPPLMELGPPSALSPRVPSPVGSTGTTKRVRPAVRSGLPARLLLPGALVLMLGGAGFGYLGARAPRSEPAAAAMPPVQADPAPAAPAAQPAAVREPEPAVVAQTAPGETAPATVAASKAPQHAPGSPTRRSRACTPPYRVTPDGHKHFKPECL